MTNVELITDLMQGNPIVQCFVIDAVGKQAERMSNAKREDWPENCFMSFDAWQSAAKKCKDAIDNR